MPSDINGIHNVTRAIRTGQAPADPALWKSAQEFQEIFLGQLVKTMRSSENQSDFFEAAPGREAFDDMFSEAIGRQMAKSGTMGLQDAIYRQIGGAYTETKVTGKPETPTQLDQVE